MMTPLNGPGEKDWNKGFKNALKMKMNGKIRELRDSLEPKPKKALRELKSPFLFLSNSKEELKTKDHFSRKTPDSFLPDIFSSPFQEPQPRDPWAVKVPPFYLSKPQPQPQGLGQHLLLPKKSDWRLSLGATQDKMMKVREWRQNIQPESPVEFRAKKKEVMRPRTPPMNLRLRPELAVTQEKMARVREWRQNFQPEAPVDFRVPKKVAKVGKRREKEVIRPRTPHMDFRLRPELAVTEDKMAKHCRRHQPHQPGGLQTAPGAGCYPEQDGPSQRVEGEDPVGDSRRTQGQGWRETSSRPGEEPVLARTLLDASERKRVGLAERPRPVSPAQRAEEESFWNLS